MHQPLHRAVPVTVGCASVWDLPAGRAPGSFKLTWLGLLPAPICDIGMGSNASLSVRLHR